MKQLSLITPNESLERFRIPHRGKRITYGDISRKLAALWRAKNFSQAQELALEASVMYKEPNWLKIYAAPNEPR